MQPGKDLAILICNVVQLDSLDSALMYNCQNQLACYTTGEPGPYPDVWLASLLCNWIELHDIDNDAQLPLSSIENLATSALIIGMWLLNYMQNIRYPH